MNARIDKFRMLEILKRSVKVKVYGRIFIFPSDSFTKGAIKYKYIGNCSARVGLKFNEYDGTYFHWSPLPVHYVMIEVTNSKEMATYFFTKFLGQDEIYFKPIRFESKFKDRLVGDKNFWIYHSRRHDEAMLVAKIEIRAYGSPSALYPPLDDDDLMETLIKKYRYKTKLHSHDLIEDKPESEIRDDLNDRLKYYIDNNMTSYEAWHAYTSDQSVTVYISRDLFKLLWSSLIGERSSNGIT